MARAVLKALIFLTVSLHLSSAVTHSLQYIYTAVTGINFPEFTAVGQVDGEQFSYYDSNIRRETPKTEWIQKINAEDPDYWSRNTQKQQGAQEVYRVNVATAMQRFNQTKGVHTVQMMCGCERDDDGTTRGYTQYGYDGEDFLSLDLKTKTWIAAKPQAVSTKHKWDSTGAEANDMKNYLQNTCIKWLKKYVSYGRETLERKVRPEASLFQKHSPSPEVVCHATGFFPKAVMISWQKDGEDVYEDVELRETLPNQDGSFQKRSILTVPAEELQKHTYTCVIQHSSLEKELVLPVRVPDRESGLLSEPLVSSTLEAEAGDNVTIWCQHNLNYRGSIFWFKHTSDSVPRLLGCKQIFTSAASYPCSYFTETERMVMAVQGRFTSLTITAVNVSDTGLYYCSSMQMDRINFSNSTSFHVKDRNKILSENLDRATGVEAEDN
ncbi:BOLA class I histocompatibility antigen, alpha chain BL3-7 isoform X2 [Pangasianodon hypophthalmus]|uniref:BOLA class I histocompatibility antigen, alpha chain BL3-7 isoform X2 n=1 Tax=Pangasianodon hypophthalmus TaxID=310915 RepID=UPI002307CE54|nr:BOLA class I histocompatibility antigen, alpha chain BL3-7 isoform X2 [Pangasianodon hypophthalmus]